MTRKLTDIEYPMCFPLVPIPAVLTNIYCQWLYTFKSIVKKSLDQKYCMNYEKTELYINICKWISFWNILSINNFRIAVSCEWCALSAGVVLLGWEWMWIFKLSTGWSSFAPSISRLNSRPADTWNSIIIPFIIQNLAALEYVFRAAMILYNLVTGCQPWTFIQPLPALIQTI